MDNTGMTAPTASADQPRNPLHGVTLEAIVRALEAHHGWEELARQIPIRCFSHDPSVNSSLKFLRKTPWAREKVEGLYLFVLREQARKEPAVRQDYDAQAPEFELARELIAARTQAGLTQGEVAARMGTTQSDR
jgi:uncharacterized protein (DUF2132 family)